MSDTDHMDFSSSGPEMASHATIRDYFAAKALMGLIAEPLDADSYSSTFNWTRDLPEETSGPDRMAIAAYRMADAMLRARGQ